MQIGWQAIIPEPGGLIVLVWGAGAARLRIAADIAKRHGKIDETRIRLIEQGKSAPCNAVNVAILTLRKLNSVKGSGVQLRWIETVLGFILFSGYNGTRGLSMWPKWWISTAILRNNLSKWSHGSDVQSPSIIIGDPVERPFSRYKYLEVPSHHLTARPVKRGTCLRFKVGINTPFFHFENIAYQSKCLV